MTTEIEAKVGRCGDAAPAFGGLRAWCRLPHGHDGWHVGDDGSEWTHGSTEADVIAMSELIDQWWESEDQRTVHHDGVELIASLSLARFLLDALPTTSPGVARDGGPS